MIFGILSIILSSIIAYFTIVFFMPKFNPKIIYYMLILPLVFGLSLSINSLIYIITLIIWQRFYFRSIFIHAIIILTIIVIRKKISFTSSHASKSFMIFGFTKPLNILFIAVFIYSFLQGFILLALFLMNQPHGGWDALTIWNLKARMMYLDGGEFWKNVFNPDVICTMTEYPLLIPGMIASLWSYFGDANIYIPIIIAGGFCLSIIIMLFSSLLVIKGPKEASCASVLLIGTPFFLQHAASQYADIPLAFFFLASYICLFMKNTFSSKNKKINSVFLAGIFVGLSCWVKNEGLLFAVGFFAGYAIISITSKKKEAVHDLLLLTLGFLPFVIALFIFNKTHVAQQSNFLSQNWSVIVNDVLNLKRHSIIVRTLFLRFVYFGQWQIVPWPFIALLIFMFKNTNKNKFIFPSLMTETLVILIILMYYCTYLLSPYDLKWHLENSLDRLLMQLFPSIVFLIFCNVDLDRIKTKN